MNKGFASTRLLAAAAIVAFSTAPADAQTVPIPGVRTMRDVQGAKELQDPALAYRIVFDVKSMADSAADPSPSLEFIAGLVNTFAKNGVPPAKMHLVAVFHGPSILLLARDATYAARTGVLTNPNLRLLAQLERAGVVMDVCGQSAAAQHYAAADLIPEAAMTLSATVTFLNLQTRGYIKLES